MASPVTAGASAPATAFWQRRGALSWSSILPTYWDATDQLHRRGLIEALRTFPRFETVRELGCCAGTNLALIRREFPYAAAEGIDVSVEAVSFAQDKLAADPYIRVRWVDMLEDALWWEPCDVDVIVSCYALAYIAPEDLPGLLRHAVRSARVGIVLVEPIKDGESERLPGNLVEWRHNYVGVLQDVLSDGGRRAELSSGMLSEPVERCDGVVRVIFDGGAA